jgi:GxxExxY protein
MELKKREIPFKSKVKLDVYYGDTKLDKIYVADLICYEEIIIEIKVSAFQHPDHFRQLLNYLKVTGYKIGLLINFGMASLKVKRMINTPSA